MRAIGGVVSDGMGRKGLEATMCYQHSEPKGTMELAPARKRPRPGTTSGHAKIPATTYFPERLPSQYLRRWRA